VVIRERVKPWNAAYALAVCVYSRVCLLPYYEKLIDDPNRIYAVRLVRGLDNTDLQTAAVRVWLQTSCFIDVAYALHDLIISES
jgi:hypothetical protein